MNYTHEDWATAPKDGSVINVQFPDGTQAQARWNTEGVARWEVLRGQGRPVNTGSQLIMLRSNLSLVIHSLVDKPVDDGTLRCGIRQLSRCSIREYQPTLTSGTKPLARQPQDARSESKGCRV